MKRLMIIGVSTLLFACGGEEKKEEKKENESLAKAKTKCEEMTKNLFGTIEGFEIKSSRADEREKVKLALDEKYEASTKIISSVTYMSEGEEKLCTCYINDKNEILNLSEMSKN